MELNFGIKGLDALDAAWIGLAEDLGYSKARRIFNKPFKTLMKPVENKIRANTPIGDKIPKDGRKRLKTIVKTRVGIPNRNELAAGNFTKDDVVLARTGWTWQRGKKQGYWTISTAVEYGTHTRGRRQDIIKRSFISSLNSVRNGLVPIMQKTLKRRYEKHFKAKGSTVVWLV